MASFLLKVGDLDITDYVRSAPGEGIDGLFDTDFEQPQFADNPLAEGGTLSVLDVGLMEKAIPLYLNDSTPALLRTLVRNVNREIRKPGLIRVEWRPPGGTDSTFYDLEAARFEPSYSVRHEEGGWLAGILRVWVQPYGHTATERIIATAAGTGAVLTVSIP